MQALEHTELRKIKTRLIKAGFKVETGSRSDVLYIEGEHYTITCYFSDEFQQWRLTPYDDRIQREVREALENA